MAVDSFSTMDYDCFSSLGSPERSCRGPCRQPEELGRLVAERKELLRVGTASRCPRGPDRSENFRLQQKNRRLCQLLVALLVPDNSFLLMKLLFFKFQNEAFLSGISTAI